MCTVVFSMDDSSLIRVMSMAAARAPSIGLAIT